MQYELRHHNRLTFPTRHVLVCEDVLSNQANLAVHFSTLFEHEGLVMVSYVASAVQAHAVMQQPPGVHLVILDRDMPYGNGDDLLAWFKNASVVVPVITFSGIPQNNDAMILQGAQHRFEKHEVLSGKADALIKQILGLT